MTKTLTSFHSWFPTVKIHIRCLGIGLLLTLISLIDVETPSYIGLTGFYFIPIMLAAWYCGKSMLSFVVAVTIFVNSYMAYGLFPAHTPHWQEAFAYMSSTLTVLGFSIFVVKFRDTIKRLHADSITDCLTGLRTRKSFIDTGNFELARAKRTKQSLTLALLDVDNFKKLNDTQGHAAGDALLVSLSRNMTSQLREIDCIGRLGGDEFVILLPNSTKEQAEEILNRARSNLRPLFNTFSSNLSISVGAVTLTPDNSLSLDIEDLLKYADNLMYEVKHRTKDGINAVKLN